MSSSIQISVALWKTQIDDFREKSERDFEEKIDFNQITARFFDTKVCSEENRERLQKNRNRLNCLSR